MKQIVHFILNGEPVQVEIEPHLTLLQLLRDQLELTGTKEGCGMGECGACTVLLDGEPVCSCMLLAADAVGHEITTVEGLGTPERPHPLQRAFLDEQAGQCGYCLSGILISAKALLDRNPQPTRAEIARALDDNICRCGSHNRILRAVAKAAAMREEAAQ